MIKRRYIIAAGIIMVIILSLSCISGSAKAAQTTNEIFNPYLMQDAPGETVPESTPAATGQPPVTELEAITTSHVVSATQNEITIEWEAVPEAEGYELNISYNGMSYNVETTGTTFTIPSLDTATICSYQIRYFKTILGIKTYSSASGVFQAATTAGKVSGPAITGRTAYTATSAAINLTWDAMNNASYKIYYKPVSGSTFTLAGETASTTYTIEGLNASEKYEIYIQSYCLNQENTGPASDILSVYTCPAAITNFSIVKEESHEIGLSWDENPTGSSYYIYRSVNDTPYELYKVTTGSALSETGLDAGTVYSYMVCSYLDITGLTSTFTEPLRAVTTPYVTTGLVLSGNTADSIHLSWDYNETATGYIIYRRKGSGGFGYLTSTTDTSYTDNGLSSGKNYRYKIMTYADTEQHTSGFSDVQKTSTLPAQVNVTSKAGYGKLRLTWKKVTGAEGYYIYQQNGGNYKLIDTIDKAETLSKVYENLTPGTTYEYNIVAYRNAFSKEFISEDAIINIIPRVSQGTTTVPSYYKTKQELLNSDAWKNVPIIKKSAVYNKSYTIPGIRSTNVNGFESTAMCPQGLTFARNYVLISAYDSYGEENSVIYVLDKEFKDLLTVIILPDKTHAGGITFDGSNVWITKGKNVCAVDFKEIETAANEYDTFKTVQYTETYNLGKKASFLTWHKDQLWAGSFEDTGNGSLRSYKISRDGDNKLTMEEQSCVTIPPAVQGVAFSGKKMILSRAYGYTSELNIYKPSGIGKTSMKTGKIIKTVQMPALNEEIAISGNYIYVNFESATPGSQALNHMDRVLAIKLKAVLK